MSEVSIKNTRIAKNVLVLYARMLLLMLVSLYTSRVVLNALGVEDYGIYNVVGGVVSMFSILSGSLTAAISRFITFELGKGDVEKLKKVFSTAVNVQLMLIVIIVLLLETIGLWFLNYKMVIPESRLIAANWVYQCSVITFAINLWSVPYNATIIAHEKMSAFAYIGIFDAVAKLLISLLIIFNPIDRLIFYGILVLLVGIIQRFMYKLYCKRHFEETQYHFKYDKEVTKELFNFAGWNFIGASSAVLRDQGGNILINIFFGPTVNAARGIAMTVNTALTSLVQNFTTAINPQITKSYANNDREYCLKLIFLGARIILYLMLFFCLPIIFETDYILEIWLQKVPNYSVSFTRLVLVYTMVEAISYPMVTLMLATGNIKRYQIIVGGCQMLNLPLAYMALKLGASAESVFEVSIAIATCCMFLRLHMLKKMLNFPTLAFLKHVYLNVLLVAIVSIPLPLFTKYNLEESLFRAIVVSSVSLICTFLSIAFIGCTKDERKKYSTMALMFLKSKLK